MIKPVNQIADMSPEDKRSLLAKLIQEKAAKPTSSFPLSYGQQSFWSLYKLAPDSAPYNLSYAARIDSTLDILVLRRSYQALVDRHPALRTTFHSHGDKPFQRIHEHMNIQFVEQDASNWDQETLNSQLTAEARRPFNLERGPLIRVYMYTRSAKQHIMMFIVHHIVGDFWALSIILKELRLLYHGEKTGEKVTLPSGELQYQDFVRWQANLVSNPVGEQLWLYWQKQLAGELSLLDFPTDKPRPSVQQFQESEYSFIIGKKLTSQLKILAKNEGATLFMALLTAYVILLYRYTHLEDIKVVTPTVGRSRPEFESIVGYFVNHVVLRVNLSGNPTFKSLLYQVRQTVLDALEHKDYPFPLLVKRIQPSEKRSSSPLFPFKFNMLSASPLGGQGAPYFKLGKGGIKIDMGDFKMEVFRIEQRVIATCDLHLTILETHKSLAASLQYNTDIFYSTTVVRMMRHYHALLKAIVAGIERRLTDFNKAFAS